MASVVRAGPIVAPYQDVSIGLLPSAPRVMPGPDGQRPPVVVWAFATGECGEERWASEAGGVTADGFAAANVGAALATGQRYIVSTGGALGSFTCNSAEGLARFVARYDTAALHGFDFDIEGHQSPAQIDALVRQLAALARSRPALRLSFTLATHAASDGSRRGLNGTGLAVLDALRRHGLNRAVINLMVMDYGPPTAAHCVVAGNVLDGGCAMGRSALQAARNLRERHGVPYARIALTAMLGENDVAANVFRPEDARMLVAGARRLGLEGLHYWSLGRDRPCAAGEPRVSPNCHGLPGVPTGSFGRILSRR